MAGITDYVLRSLVRKYSKTALLTTEMISSEALTQVKDVVITKRDNNHSPIAYQLSGHKPEMIANCAKYLEKFATNVASQLATWQIIVKCAKAENMFLQNQDLLLFMRAKLVVQY